mgnify:CR=1 FL=1
MKEEVPNESWCRNKQQHGDGSQDLDNSPSLVRVFRDEGQDNEEEVDQEGADIEISN